MKVSVDPNRCQGHTRCNMVAPQLFKIEEDEGYAYVDDPVVKPGDEQAAQDGADNCPEKAIIIER